MTNLDHEIHVVGEPLRQLIASVCMSPLLHYRLRAGTRGAKVLLGFNSFALPDRIYAGNEFTEGQNGRLCDKDIRPQIGFRNVCPTFIQLW